MAVLLSIVRIGVISGLGQCDHSRTTFDSREYRKSLCAQNVRIFPHVRCQNPDIEQIVGPRG